MYNHNKSESRAREILKSYVHASVKEFNDYIYTILLVGSLTNGSYIEGPGRDIDQITVLNDKTPDTIRSSLLQLIDEIQHSFNNDIPIAKSVYNYSEMIRPFKKDIRDCIEDKYLLEITTELTRIHESGVILYGKDIISQLPIPTRDEIIFFDERARVWSNEMNKKMPSRNTQEELPIHIIVQIILTNAFRHYYYSTGKSCSNKHEIATRINNEIKNYKFGEILTLATEFKINPYKDFSKEKIQQIRNKFIEFQEWIKKNSVYAVPLK